MSVLETEVREKLGENSSSAPREETMEGEHKEKLMDFFSCTFKTVP